MPPKHVLGILAAVTVLGAEAALPIDQEVTGAALNHFASREDASIGRDGLILIQSKTRKWTGELLRMFSLRRGNDACPITDELYDQLIERNSGEVPAEALIRASPRWRLALPMEENSVGGRGFNRSASGEPVRTVVSISRPAWSAKGDRAFVMFSFQWSMHSAIAHYLVERSTDGWTVKCSQLRFYP